MARVTLDEECWTKIGKIKSRFSIDDNVILAAIIKLWHSTQMDKIYICDSAEITDHAEIWNLSEEDQAKLIKGMVWVGLLHDLGDNGYEIVGNRGHIENIEALKAKRSKAGKKAAAVRWGNKNSKTHNIKSESQDSKSESEERGSESDATVCESYTEPCESHSGYAAIQPNTVQSNTIHTNAEQVAPVEPEPCVTDGDVKRSRELISLWNRIMGNNRAYSGMDIAGKHRSKFELSIGFAPYNKIDAWEKLFIRIKSSEWLMSKSFVILTWAIDYDNIVEIESGKYDSNTQSSNDPDRTYDFLDEGPA